MNKVLLAQAANEARGLAMDAVHKCSSGHLGLPLGAADIGAVLFGESLQCDPADPKWLNRDRFILSAGHGSMFIYGWLHLSGYDVSIDDVSKFRVLHSITPGHPEFHETPGVECTTGPLGQGIGNAVGYALSGKMAAAKYNTADHKIIDNHIIALAGDGCLQEGVAREAVAFAAHNGLDNLIVIFDSNDVTLDAMAKVTQSEDAQALYTALGWDAVTIDGHDLEAIKAAIDTAKAADNGKPKIIIAKTVIAKGIPEVAGTAKGHGEGGAKFIDAAKKGIGLPEGTHFYVSDEVKGYFADLKAKRAAAHAEWNKSFEAWSAANPEKAAELKAAREGGLKAEDLLKLIPETSGEGKAATRNSGGEILNHIAKAVPHLITGSADLFGSTKNYIKDGGDFSAANPTGRNIWFGIREHAMGAICNGIAYDGLFLASGATFLVFADYCRPSIRLASLAKLPVTYIFTHDSVGVGEDGPTHQPVEQEAQIRLMEQLKNHSGRNSFLALRPADGAETLESWKLALENRHGPSGLILSRQGIADLPAETTVKAAGTAKGSYIVEDCEGKPDVILLANGSEVATLIAGAARLRNEKNLKVRIVSVPSEGLFRSQTLKYQRSVLPGNVPVFGLTAGLPVTLQGLAGSRGRVFGLSHFGYSAPFKVLDEKFGFTGDNVFDQVLRLLK
ncbi:MAG TPA: transketolase [Verrucomicrobiales bacterium]|nr:transketolase [Verrucomicrobiales bacterium]